MESKTYTLNENIYDWELTTLPINNPFTALLKGMKFEN